MPACLVAGINSLERIQRKATQSVTGIRYLSYETDCSGWAFISCTGNGYKSTWVPHPIYLPFVGYRSEPVFFCLPLVTALEGTTLRCSKVQATAGGDGKFPSSVITALSVKIVKQRVDEGWTDVFPYLPYSFQSHLPNSISMPRPQLHVPY